MRAGEAASASLTATAALTDPLTALRPPPRAARAAGVAGPPAVGNGAGVAGHAAAAAAAAAVPRWRARAAARRRATRHGSCSVCQAQRPSARRSGARHLCGAARAARAAAVARRARRAAAPAASRRRPRRCSHRTAARAAAASLAAPSRTRATPRRRRARRRASCRRASIDWLHARSVSAHVTACAARRPAVLALRSLAALRHARSPRRLARRQHARASSTRVAVSRCARALHRSKHG